MSGLCNIPCENRTLHCNMNALTGSFNEVFIQNFTDFEVLGDSKPAPETFEELPAKRFR